MCLKQRKNVVWAGILVMKVVSRLIFALYVRFGLGACCCSSPGSFLMVEVDYLVKAVGCYKYRCVLCSSLHLLSLSIEILLFLFLTLLFSYFLIILVVFLLLLVVC